MASKLISEDELRKYPQLAPNGIYILSIDGFLYKPNTWTKGAEDVVGVALISDNCRFVIAPDSFANIPYANINIIIPGVFKTEVENIALLDFNGQRNTDAIISAYGVHGALLEGINDSTNSAAYKCFTYMFANGKRGYLGSVGELNEILNNYNIVEDALTIIEGDPLFTNSQRHDILWGSTQCDGDAWVVDFYGGGVGYHYGLTQSFGVRPLCPL